MDMDSILLAGIKMAQKSMAQKSLDNGIRYDELIAITSFYPIEPQAGQPLVIDVQEISTSLGLDGKILAPVFEEYASRGFLNKSGEGIYTMHPSIRQYLKEQAMGLLSQETQAYLDTHARPVIEHMVTSTLKASFNWPEAQNFQYK